MRGIFGKMCIWHRNDAAKDDSDMKISERKGNDEQSNI